MIISLKKINANNFSIVGSKAFRLGELYKKGFTVPKGFILTTNVFDEFLKNNHLLPLVNCLRLNKKEKVLYEICKELQIKIIKGKVKVNIRQEINKSLENLSAKKIAVRSSAICEDGENASFAGQFTSYLPLPANQVLRAVKKCWASVFNKRVLTYAFFHKIPIYKIKMACLIQEVINGKIGGLIFTKNVLSDNNDTLLIEALAESPQSIVSGMSNPNRWIIEKENGVLVDKYIANKKWILNQHDLKQLYTSSFAIEQFYQKPQDIEWIIKNGKLIILQTRPITH